jgi:hypothetical protein
LFANLLDRCAGSQGKITAILNRMIKTFPFWRLAFLLALILAHNRPAECQSATQTPASPGLRNAVVLIIRHAEKPESGSGLSPAGEQRAEAYVNYFKTFTLDSRPMRPDYLFATADSEGSHRPRLTIEPLSHALGLKIDDRFKNKNFEELARELQLRRHGKCVLIAWHHGEIPELLQTLGADPAALLPTGKWPPEIFSWVIELHFDGEGRLIQSSSKRINENLMPGDSAR